MIFQVFEGFVCLDLKKKDRLCFEVNFNMGENTTKGAVLTGRYQRNTQKKVKRQSPGKLEQSLPQAASQICFKLGIMFIY